MEILSGKMQTASCVIKGYDGEKGGRSYPKHLAQVGVSKAEGDVGDMETFRGHFPVCGFFGPRYS